MARGTAGARPRAATPMATRYGASHVARSVPQPAGHRCADPLIPHDLHNTTSDPPMASRGAQGCDRRRTGAFLKMPPKLRSHRFWVHRRFSAKPASRSLTGRCHPEPKRAQRPGSHLRSRGASRQPLNTARSAQAPKGQPSRGPVSAAGWSGLPSEQAAPQHRPIRASAKGATEPRACQRSWVVRLAERAGMQGDPPHRARGRA